MMNGLVSPKEEYYDDILEPKSSGAESIDAAGAAATLVDDDEQQQADSNPRPRKRSYHRHSLHQIQQLETFYNQNPYPDDKQRKELGLELGLEPLQIKFWFQNKRTQMKAKENRQENVILKTENEKLCAENMRCKEALTNTKCTICGGPATASLGEMANDNEQYLKMENAQLRQEIERVLGILKNQQYAEVTGFPGMVNQRYV